jgi:hypothetical protein
LLGERADLAEQARDDRVVGNPKPAEDLRAAVDAALPQRREQNTLTGAAA